MAQKKEQSFQFDDEAQLLFSSFEALNQDQKRSKWASVVNLLTLVVLFIESVGGIALAVIQMLQPIDIDASYISRDLVLVAASMGLLYICVHIRGAFTSYRRTQPGPPQIYGNYLHASALLIARLAIAVWLAALIATAVMISRAVPIVGSPGKMPYLNLLVCVGAILSFITISYTIEKNATPFATIGLSRPSLLSYTVSAFANDLSADVSVSRRASLQGKSRQNCTDSMSDAVASKKLWETRKETPANITVEYRESSDDAKTELIAGSEAQNLRPIPQYPTAPKESSYNRGGWRNEWNNVPKQVGVVVLTELSSSGRSPPTTEFSTSFSSPYSASTNATLRTSAPRSIGHIRTVTPTSSIISSARRSALSSVRYAEKPDEVVQIAVRLVNTLSPSTSPVKAKVRGVLHSPTSNMGNEAALEMGFTTPPRPAKLVAMLRGAQGSHHRNLSQETLQRQRPVSTGNLGALKKDRKPQNLPGMMNRQYGGFARRSPPSRYRRRGSESSSGSAVMMMLPVAYA